MAAVLVTRVGGVEISSLVLFFLFFSFAPLTGLALWNLSVLNTTVPSGQFVWLVGSEGEVVAMAEFKLCTLPYIHLGESSTLRMTASG
jgi:hypothetical protein